MLWCKLLACLALFVSIASSAILPERIAKQTQSAPVEAVVAPDEPLWKEYGFESGERATYGGLTVTAYRFIDPTGAFAGYQLLRGEARAGGEQVFQHANYVLTFRGAKVSVAQASELGKALPSVRNASLPVIQQYLPSAGLIRGSERSILGPESLQRLAPSVPVSVVDFSRGAEGEVARYRSKQAGREHLLLLVSYPTPQMAAERLKAYSAVPGIVARKTGPILAAVIGTEDMDEAQKLISTVTYKPNVMWNEKEPEDISKVADMLVSIGVITAVAAGASVLVALVFAGILQLFIRVGWRQADNPLTTLHLE